MRAWLRMTISLLGALAGFQVLLLQIRQSGLPVRRGGDRSVDLAQLATSEQEADLFPILVPFPGPAKESRMNLDPAQVGIDGLEQQNDVLYRSALP